MLIHQNHSTLLHINWKHPILGKKSKVTLVTGATNAIDYAITNYLAEKGDYA